MAKFNWEKALHKTWFFTKCLFAVMALMTATYYWGTYNPNKKAIKVANEELEIFYIQKIKDMELREPEFVYNNDIQFVRAMHKCIDYINLISILHGEERMTRLNGLPLNITNDPRFSLYAFH